jgi:Amt family ammonium transporter
MGRLIEFDRGRFWLPLLVLAVGALVLGATAQLAIAQDETATEEVAVEEVAEAPAEEAEEAAEDPSGLNTTLNSTSFALDTIWVIIAGCLVMWMQAGFALVECGLTRAKNAVNICMKNLLDFSFGSILFWIIGFSLMFGAGGSWNGFWGGLDGMFLRGGDEAFPGIAWALVPLDAKFFFQLVFAATTATIVSGAMAERTKFVSYMVYSVIVSAIIYPISGHWIWGEGWLASMETPFSDFAGSTVVHSCGGWLALAGAIVLGPRIGKFAADGSPRAIPGHNLVLVTLGVFILWLGWFGFNPGSTMSADAGAIASITVNTNAAAAMAAIAAIFTAKALFGKWEGTMALNGALAGLVAITAPCASVTTGASILIGLVAGILVVFSVLGIEKILKVDDPVGAISVHGVCGAWGTLSLGLFATEGGLFNGGGSAQLVSQAIGVVAVFAWAFGTGMVLFLLVKNTIGLRVTPEEEREGLDFGEHGNEAYHGFVLEAMPEG